ncbi:MAG: hypothetical protein WCD70_13445 [Alphaproteobacteria bacterium]
MANRPRNYNELNKAHEAAKGQIPIVPKATSHEKNKRKDERRKRPRPNRLIIYLPPDKFAATKAKIKESGLPYGDCVARAVLGLRIPPQVDRASFRAAMWELGKIGTNWNQMTKLAHQRGKVPECAILERVGADIQAAIQRLTPK